MFSKVSVNPLLWRSLGFRNSLFTTVAKSSTTAEVVNYSEKKEQLLAKLNTDLPKPYDGPERDLVNFPRRVRREKPDKVRFAFFPDEWFTFFYKKTGVTGPYIFGAGLITFLLSKELYVIEQELSTGIAQCLLIFIVHKKFGPKIKEWAIKLDKTEEMKYENQRQENIRKLEGVEAGEKRFQLNCTMIDPLCAAKKENVHMQLETEYRRRLMTVYETVKKRLDYHLEMDNTRRQMEQKYMVEWIVDSVVKSITAQQEKEALQKCLLDLKAISAKA